MNKKEKMYWILAAVMLVLFGGLILLLKGVDVAAIGPQGSKIGLSALNGAVRDQFPFHEWWYEITDWMSLLVLLIPACFALLGLWQLMKGKSLKAVDRDIYLLGGFYVVVFAAYLFFDQWVINFRPVLIEGVLEPSFPSSHTMIFICVMATAIHQISRRFADPSLKGIGRILLYLILTFVLVGRIISGVHWFTDILGGIFLSLFFIFIYLAVDERLKK